MFKVPEKYRIRSGSFASDKFDGCNGAFIIPSPFTKNGHPFLHIIASDGECWEHVSVSFEFRTPTWEEMCYVKSVFWDDEDTVMQLHPPKSSYINNHKFCLHLWRPTSANIPTPHYLLVGFKGLNPDEARKFSQSAHKASINRVQTDTE